MYTSLVKMFYSNLYYVDGIVSYEVIKHKISISLNKYVEIMDLPCIRPVFNPIKVKECNNYNYEIDVSSFLLYPKSCISSPFTVGLMRPGIRLVHYVMNHIRFTRKIVFSHLTIYDVSVVWLISNKVETN